MIRIVFFVVTIKYLIFVLLTLCSESLISQNNFFKWYPSPGHEITNDIVQTLQGDYLLVGQKGVTTDTVHSRILKINQIGAVVDEIVFPNPEGSSTLNTIDRLPGSDHHFLLTGSRDSASQNGYYSILQLMIVNDSMEILLSKEYTSTKDRQYRPWKVKFAGANIFYLLYQFDTVSGSNTYDFGVGKFDLSLNKISTFHHANQYPWYIGQDIVFRNADNTIQIYYIGQNMIGRYSALQIISLSEDLNLISNYPGPDQLITNISATRIDDSTCYLFGTDKPTVTLQNQHLGCYLLMDSNEVLKSVDLLNNPDTILYAGRGGFNLTVNPTTLMATMAGMYNFDPAGREWQSTPTWVQLIKTDFDLNLIDQKFYGGDAQYIPYSIKPTNDGGTIITGNRFDFNTPGKPQYDVFVLKTDSAGTILSLPKNQQTLISEAILAPNPGGDYCFALLGPQYKSAILRMYDMSGVMLLYREIQQQKSKIELPGLAQGVYPYAFENNGKIIGSGKWIRK
ncbi:MAG: T9SS type A sorting domain-containing protein [bacterium]